MTAMVVSIQEWTSDLRRLAACRDAPPELFITAGDDPDERPYPPPAARRLCDICPVRAMCLNLGIALDADGIWGGTTRYQRRQLRKRAPRAVCPGCGGRYLVEEGKSEICLTCGISWDVVA